MEDEMKMRIILVAIIAFAVLSVAFLYFERTLKHNSVLVYKNEDILYANSIISDAYTDKARYNPGDRIALSIEFENRSDTDVNGDVYINLKEYDKTVGNWKISGIKLGTGEKAVRTVQLDVPASDFKGYLLEIWYKNSTNYLDCKTTAIDISSDWTRFPRYGYIASFNKQDKQAAADITNSLNKFHINSLMFYDWQFRHDSPLADNAGENGSRWEDIAKRPIYGDTVRDYIAQSHNRNIACMNYNLMFGALNNYKDYGVNQEWSVFKDNGHETQDFHPLPSSWLSDKIFLFNPGNSNWQNYIINKEKDVFDVFDFDGWHIDQLGSRGALFDYSGNQVDLAQGYLSFINTAGAQLKDKKLAFNAVDMYGQNIVAQSEYLPFLYAEIWSTSSYYSLKSAIDNGYRYTDNKKSTVIAAYMNYKKSGGEFNEASVRLADAVIFAGGGDHLELGDHGMLSSEYFPNAKLAMSDSLTQAARSYYDFMVAYENLLRDNCIPLKNEISIDNVRTGSGPLPGLVWYFAKSNGKYDILHLINLTSNSSNNWRDDNGQRKPPELKQNLALRYYTSEKIGKVMMASPDSDESIMISLDFTSSSDQNGSYIGVTVPSLEYWDMIVFEKSE